MSKLSDRVRPGSEAAPWVCDEIRQLESELAAARSDAMSAIKLVTDIRFALGDNGKRMQTELIEWCKTLAPEVKRADEFKCPICRSTYFSSHSGFVDGKFTIFSRYCKGWPTGYDRSYTPCIGKYVQKMTDREVSKK